MTTKAAVLHQALQVAISYFKSGQFHLAEILCRKALESDGQNVDFMHLLGLTTSESGRYAEAVKLFERAIKLRKKDPLLLFTLALTLQRWEKPDKALLQYKKAVAIKHDYIEALINMGDILKSQDKFDEAEQQYKQALKIKPESAEAHNNLGTIFERQKKPDEAEAMFRQAISIKPDYAAAYYNLGTLLEKCERMDEAVEYYAKAVNFKSPLALMNISLGVVFQRHLMINEALSLYEQAFQQQPDGHLLLSEIVRLRYSACLWDKLDVYQEQLLDMIRRRREGISMFAILGSSATAKDLLVYAQSFHRNTKQPPQNLFTHSRKKSGGKIKIGYLSSDFHTHATAQLMIELFERHDRSRFDITGYSYGPDDGSPMRKRLVSAFDNFVDLKDLSDREAAERIFNDGIDILIDLKGGLTERSRIGISAYRPAPIQANYLGYPGTMGVDFIDYIIADRFIIPENHEQFYSEKVVCLPDCYQPNDTHRKIAEAIPTKEVCGLPARGFVFCCFNANYKMTSQVFDIWMRLLQKVPDSVLWLFEDNRSVKENLGREAERRGVPASRLVFAPSLPLAEHLARHSLADLFLDTLPVNAHTTTSDALWAGLPVLTCVGKTFAGRVAGSLLKAANLPELITYSLEDYEALALRLAQDPARLGEIRQKLQSTRLQMPLFDIEKFTRNIEKSYQTMWDIWQNGEKPKPFSVS